MSSGLFSYGDFLLMPGRSSGLFSYGDFLLLPILVRTRPSAGHVFPSGHNSPNGRVAAGQTSR
jgi:hypothetical protein